MAVAFDTLSKVFGNAVDVAERVAAKQDAYDLSAASHQVNLLDADDDRGFQKFSTEPLDPQKLDENEYIKDDKVAKYRKNLNSPEQVAQYDKLVETWKIRRQTRINSHVAGVLKKSSIEATSLQMERQQEIASTDLNAESVGQVQRLARSNAILKGLTPEVADQLVEKATDDVFYNHIKMVAGTQNYREVVARYDKLKGQFGSREIEAEQIVKAAKNEVATDAMLGDVLVTDDQGNIDAIESLRKTASKIGTDTSEEQATMLSRKVSAKIELDRRERKTVGDQLSKQLDSLVLTGSDQDAAPLGRGDLTEQIKTFVAENREAFARAPDDVREAMIERIKNPTKSNYRDENAFRTYIAGAEAGNVVAMEKLLALNRSSMVLSASDAQALENAQIAFRSGKFDEQLRKKRSSISEEGKKYGIVEPNYAQIQKDGTISPKEQKIIDRWKTFNDMVMDRMRVNGTLSVEDAAAQVYDTKVVRPEPGFWYATHKDVSIVDLEENLATEYGPAIVASRMAALPSSTPRQERILQVMETLSAEKDRKLEKERMTRLSGDSLSEPMLDAFKAGLRIYSPMYSPATP